MKACKHPAATLVGHMEKDGYSMDLRDCVGCGAIILHGFYQNKVYSVVLQPNMKGVSLEEMFNIFVGGITFHTTGKQGEHGKAWSSLSAKSLKAEVFLELKEMGFKL